MWLVLNQYEIDHKLGLKDVFGNRVCKMPMYNHLATNEGPAASAQRSQRYASGNP
jgi:hypothetical protein